MKNKSYEALMSLWNAEKFEDFCIVYDGLFF